MEPRPDTAQKIEERKEFGELFVNLDDDDESDTELINFMPEKVIIYSSNPSILTHY